MTPALHLLAQSGGIPVAVQLEAFVERLLSPVGLAVAVASLGIGLALVAVRRVDAVLLVAALTASTFQANHRPDSNTLLGPLQSFRFFSKPLAFLLILVALFFSFGIARGDRRSPAGFASSSLLLFQCYYLAQFAVFAGDGFLKGAFGVVTALLTWWTFSCSLGRRMQDVQSATRTFDVFAVVGAFFVLVNLAQIILGLGGAMEAGRLAGIGGNAQMMGCISGLLLIFNLFIGMGSGAAPRIRTLSLVNAGFLGVFVLGTGSRTAALACFLAGLIMFRHRIGRIAIAGFFVAGATLVISVAFSDVTAIAAERLRSTEDTRTAGWLMDLENFYQSPVFGKLPFLEVGEVPSGIESVVIRTLSAMGIVGLLVLAPFGLGIASACLKAFRLMRLSPEHAELSSLFLACCAALFVFNTFDGYAFGLLTFPVIAIYIVATLGSFLAEESDRLSLPESQQLVFVDP